MTKRHARETPGHMIGDLFTFVLFAAFLLLSLLIVVIGVDGYRSVVDASDSVSGVRTTLGYVAGKIRSEAAQDGVRIEEMAGVNALVLTEVYEDTPYDTVIYYLDGALYETSGNLQELEFEPEYGQRLIEISGFEAEWTEENLLKLTAISPDGRSQSTHLAVRTEQGGVPE